MEILNNAVLFFLPEVKKKSIILLHEKEDDVNKINLANVELKVFDSSKEAIKQGITKNSKIILKLNTVPSVIKIKDVTYGVVDFFDILIVL